eukprot:COSAG02_NODE_317_length_24808_cov_120.564329_14_plen_83_part_00
MIVVAMPSWCSLEIGAHSNFRFLVHIRYRYMHWVLYWRCILAVRRSFSVQSFRFSASAFRYQEFLVGILRNLATCVYSTRNL